MSSAGGGPAVVDAEVTLARLDDQIQWYDRKSRTCLKWFRLLKLLTIVSASLITVLSGLLDPRTATHISVWLGATVAVVEGILQLNQYHTVWINYRTTCEALKSEKYLYLAGAGPYGNGVDLRKLLAERVESIASREQGRWAARQDTEQTAAVNVPLQSK